MPISHWPEEDRPREKLLLKGEAALTDAELIAIFLQTGTRGRSALDIAKTLLTQQGGLKKLLDRPLAHFLQQPGIGKAKYAALKAAIELGKRCLADAAQPGETLNHPARVQAFLAQKLSHHTREVFACVFLDTHLRFIGFEELFYGTVNEAAVYPREIVRRALAQNATHLILAHNHPSGKTFPSLADRDITRHIQQALAWVDIRVIDHVIIGHHEPFSFAEAGMLETLHAR